MADDGKRQDPPKGGGGPPGGGGPGGGGGGGPPKDGKPPPKKPGLIRRIGISGILLFCSVVAIGSFGYFFWEAFIADALAATALSQNLRDSIQKLNASAAGFIALSMLLADYRVFRKIPLKKNESASAKKLLLVIVLFLLLGVFYTLRDFTPDASLTHYGYRQLISVGGAGAIAALASLALAFGHWPYSMATVLAVYILYFLSSLSLLLTVGLPPMPVNMEWLRQLDFMYWFIAGVGVFALASAVIILQGQRPKEDMINTAIHRLLHYKKRMDDMKKGQKSAEEQLRAEELSKQILEFLLPKKPPEKKPPPREIIATVSLDKAQTEEINRMRSDIKEFIETSQRKEEEFQKLIHALQEQLELHADKNDRGRRHSREEREKEREKEADKNAGSGEGEAPSA